MVERLGDAVHVGEEAVVVQRAARARSWSIGAEQLDGAVVERLEQVVVDAAEQGDGVVVPAPPQVVGESCAAAAGGRAARQDGERANRNDRACESLAEAEGVMERREPR